MNILFLSTRYPYPPDCGHYLRTYHTLKFLAEKNKIFFLSFLENPIREIDQEMIKLCESVDVFMLPEDVSRMHLLYSLIKNIFSPLPFVAQKYFNKQMLHRINVILDNERIDIIHVDMLPLSSYLPFFRGIPACLVEHNVEYLRVESYVKVAKNIFEKLFLRIQAVKLKRFEQDALGRFYKVFSVSREDLENLQILCPGSEYVLVPNAVDIDYFSPDRQGSCLNTLIWTGGAGEIYNRHAISYLVYKIMPILKHQRSDVKLILIGNSIDNYFSDLDQLEYIEVLGYVDDVRPYLNNASIFVAPIFSGGGTKLKILNAMAMGLAVVTTNVGAEGIGCQDGVHYLEASTPNDFADKICNLLDDPERVTCMGLSAMEFIRKNYTWDSVLEKMNYSELMN